MAEETEERRRPTFIVKGIMLGLVIAGSIWVYDWAQVQYQAWQDHMFYSRLSADVRGRDWKIDGDSTKKLDEATRQDAVKMLNVALADSMACEDSLKRISLILEGVE